MIVRRRTKVVMKGNVAIGGENPISIQSMTKSPTTDIEATLSEIEKCIDAGVDIMRISVPDEKSLRAFKIIVEKLEPTSLPIVADIHFSPKLAILSL